MKTLLLFAALFVFTFSSYTQNATIEKTKTTISINVPDFSDAEVKKFYESYALHLAKCVAAIRQKNETKVTALFKNPGEQLVTQEKNLAKELVKNPVDKEKYMQFAAAVYPYIKEVEGSVYYQKMYGNK